MARRDKTLTALVTRNEHAQIARVAERELLSISDLVRRIMVAAIASADSSGDHAERGS